MAGALAWAAVEVRARWRGTLVLILMVGLGGGIALATAAGARRTESAFDRFLDSSDYADVRLQYSTDDNVDDEVLRRLRAHPDVEEAVPLYLNVAFGEQSDFDIAVFSSPDEAFLRAVDRPRIIDGRLPDPAQPGEVIANAFTAENLGIELGDSFALATFAAEQFAEGDFAAQPDGPQLELTLVGIGRSPDELADAAFVGLFATPAYFSRYQERAGGFGPIVEISTGDGVDGEAVIDAALDGLELDERIVEDQSALTVSVGEATRVLSLGLWAFALCATLAALVASGQAVARRLSALGPDLDALGAMGMTRDQRRLGVLATATPVAIGGALLAALVAWLASPLFPIGIARSAEPDPGFTFDGVVLAVGAVAVAVAIVAVGALSALRLAAHSTSRQQAAVHEPSTTGRSVVARVARRAVGSPVAGVGMAMALEPGRGRAAVPIRPAITGAVVGITGVVAVLTFGASLDHLVDTPAQYGWNWTLSPDIFDENEGEDVPRLVASPGVRDVGRVRYAQFVAGDDELTGVAVEAVAGSPSLTVIDGRMPSVDDEIAVGTKTAERRSLGIGDSIDVEEPATGGARAMRVVGTVLFPVEDENPFNDGLAVAPTAFAALQQSDGFTQWIVTFDNGISAAEAERRLEDVLPGSMSIYARPSPPDDVANLDNVRGLPRALAAFLVVVALAAIGHALATAVRRRAGELGVLRALGMLGRQVWGIVTVQSLTLLAIGLLLGVPLGIAAGRVVWTLVADSLGVAPRPVLPALALALLVPAAVLAAVLLAAFPARRAARVRTSAILAAD